MADTGGRGTQRLPRRSGGGSRTSSARSSGVFVDSEGAGPGPGPGPGTGVGNPHLGPYYSLGPYQPQNQQHALRSAASRFSLNEQFAATRRDYEFGYDDGSSFIERSTLASSSLTNRPDDAQSDFDPTSSGLPDATRAGPVGAAQSALRVKRDHYEMLCLSRQALSPDQARRAYHRLFRLLDPQAQPPALRGTAALYLAEVQTAFEALIELSRQDGDQQQVLYEAWDDFSNGTEEEDDDEDDEDDGGDANPTDQTHPRLSSQRARPLSQPSSSTDLGIRMDATKGGHQPPFSSGRLLPPTLQPLDFCLSQSAAMPVPPLGRLLDKGIQTLRDSLSPEQQGKDDKDRRRQDFVCSSPPVLTIIGSVYGFTQDLLASAAPRAVLSDRYQPLLPETLPRQRLLHLVGGRPSPLVTLRLRQELSHGRGQCSSRAQSSPRRGAGAAPPPPPPDAVVELESDLLQGPSLTARLGRTVQVEGPGEEPVAVELMLSAGPAWCATPGMPGGIRPPPRAGVAVHRTVRSSGGTAFLCADSGDSPWPWRWWRSSSSTALAGAAADSATCDDFLHFTKGVMGGSSSSGSGSSRTLPRRGSDLPSFMMGSAPTLEVGYTSATADEMGLLAGRPLTGPADRGFKGLDHEADRRRGKRGGTWTASAAVTSSALASYLRYGVELASALPDAVRSLVGLQPTPDRYHLEMELCRTMMSSSRGAGGYLAVRLLRRIGPLSKLGVEVGFSPSSSGLHLSLYWSRQGGSQRFRVPFLLGATTRSASRVVFWALVAPFAAFAALEFARRQYSGITSRSSRKQQPSGEDAAAERVALRRAEADELTAVLATTAQVQQLLERERGGLVILSAKYGVRASSPPRQPDATPTPTSIGGWNPDYEVADVTVAVAALVDPGLPSSSSSSLLIPRRLRKSRLLGFWDPAPMQTKVLLVRYMYRGREGVLEVKGKGEVRLPPAVEGVA